MTLAVLLTFALLFGGLFVGVPSSKAEDSAWKSLDPMLDKMQNLEPDEIEFLVAATGGMVDKLFDSLTDDEELYLYNNFGLNKEGMQFASQFDTRIRNIYEGYDGFWML